MLKLSSKPSDNAPFRERESPHSLSRGPFGQYSLSMEHFGQSSPDCAGERIAELVDTVKNKRKGWFCALESLCSLDVQPKEVLPLYLDVLRDRSGDQYQLGPYMKYKVTQAIRAIGPSDEGAIKVLVEVFQDAKQDELVRKGAGQALYRATREGTARAALVPIYTEALKDSRVRGVAIQALYLAGAAESLVGALRLEIDPGTKMEVLQLLGDMGTPRAWRALPALWEIYFKLTEPGMRQSLPGYWPAGAQEEQLLGMLRYAIKQIGGRVV